MRVAFFGSPGFALPTAEMLRAEHELVLAVSQPDKPAGRGKKVTACAVATWARDVGVQLEQPSSLKRNAAFHTLLDNLKVDVAITAAYGKLLPEPLLTVPTHGFLNVHGSLLPQYRGAAPIQWALIDGQVDTGITIMQTAAGMDTGDIRLQHRVPITHQDTALSMFHTLSAVGAKVLSEALKQLNKGTLPRTAQDDTAASHARMLTKADGAVRWSDSALRIYQRYQGVYMWPSTHTTFRNKPLKIKQLEVLKDQTATGHTGEIIAIGPEGIQIATGQGIIQLIHVQPSGKPAMPARDWANGYQVRLGDHFV